MKGNKKIKKYKMIADLKEDLKRMYNQGTSFYSDNKKVQKLLEDIGVVIVCGGVGAGIGFVATGPMGALIGGTLGTLAGLIITEVIEIKSIRFDRFGGVTVVFT